MVAAKVTTVAEPEETRKVASNIDPEGLHRDMVIALDRVWAIAVLDLV